MRLLNMIKNILNLILPSNPKTSEVLPKHLEIAMKEIGVSEWAGGKQNPRIIEYHSATSLHAAEDEVSWCSAFVNWCLKRAGEQGTNNAAARSFLRWGVLVKKPQAGDVVVFWRGSKTSWQGHVAFYVEENLDAVKVLGGNQGNKVCYQWYPKSQVLDYRRLS